MELVLIAKIAAGAVLGGVAGFLLSRARICNAAACTGRINPIFSTLAGAVLGAAVAWTLVAR